MNINYHLQAVKCFYILVIWKFTSALKKITHRVSHLTQRRSLLLRLLLSVLPPLQFPAPVWARASLSPLNLHEFSWNPRAPLSSQHGYSCNLDAIHGRVSAVRGARKVSDRQQPPRFLLHISLRVYSCVSACARGFFFLPFSSFFPAAIVYFSVDKRGCQKAGRTRQLPVEQ